MHVRNKRAAQVSNGTTLVTLFTHGTTLVDPTGEASGRGGVLDRIVVDNEDTVVHTVYIYQCEVSTTGGVTNKIEAVMLQPLQTYIFEGPFFCADSGLYQAKLAEAKVTTEVSFISYYHEMASA